LKKYQNGLWEESFIFRLRTGSGRILIVWENPQPGRATYLFIANDENIDVQLKKIELYIINAIDGKRDFINENSAGAKKLRKDLMYTNEKVKHSNMNDYMVTIKSEMNRY
jgi:hypothetical protein